MPQVYNLETQKRLPEVADAVPAVLAWIRQRSPRAVVRDASAAHLPWDIEVEQHGVKARIEVKVDYVAEKTGNVVWESEEVMQEGRVMKIGWGWQPAIDYIAYILLPSWETYLLDAQRLRHYVLDRWEALETYEAEHATYKTCGKLVPLVDVKGTRIVRARAVLQPAPSKGGEYER